MKRNGIIPVLIILLASGASYLATRAAPCAHEQPTGDRLQDVAFLTRELRLDADQRQNLKSLHTSLGANLDRSCQRHCAARARLGAALATETNDFPAADAILAEMCQAYAQSERATLNHLRAVRAMLHASQLPRFDALISTCMCHPCQQPNSSCANDRADTQTNKP
jgi:hypothetical protein